jgi:hypothetical protein
MANNKNKQQQHNLCVFLEHTDEIGGTEQGGSGTCGDGHHTEMKAL